jgi:putative flippase GtrA
MVHLPFAGSDWRAAAARLSASTPGRLREIILFLAIGGSAALAYAVLSAAFTTWAGLRPSLAILLTLALLIPPTYLAQRRFTFQSDREHLSALPRYAGTQLIGNGVGLLGAEMFPTAIRSHALLAFSIIAVVVATTNYGCLKFWAFRRSQ